MERNKIGMYGVAKSAPSDAMVCALLIVSSCVFYCLIADYAGVLGVPSRANYFARLADAFNHGSLALRIDSGQVHDLIFFNGRLFLYWPPLPAILMMPLVYLWGTQLHDAWILVIVGGLNVGLSFLIARTPWNGAVLSQIRAVVLAVTFAFGSVHMPLASSSGVWATSQIISYFFLSGSLLLVLRRASLCAYLFAGILAACACLCRLSMMGAVIGIACLIVIRGSEEFPQRRAKRLLAFAAPLATCALLYFMYNAARFGSPLETGVRYHLFAPRFVSDVSQYGMFSLHYVWTNIWYHYLAYPFWPGVADPTEGASLFLMTPLYFGAFQSLRSRAFDMRTAALLLGIVLAALPSLLLFGTGWIQIGPRYTLDYTPLLLVLVGVGIGTWPTVLLCASALVSITHYALGRGYLPPM